jgi:hypothetical protein
VIDSSLSGNVIGSPARRTGSERAIFWTLPLLMALWAGAFFMFPGFVPPMSPRMPAAQVGAFYAKYTERIRWSMMLLNWFCVALIPILMLVVERMRGMAHRTPTMRYCVIGVAAAAPIAFLTATVFWLLAAFRPERAPDLTQLYNDLGWITFACGVPFLVSLCFFLAVSIYFDQQPHPVFARWIGHFNLVIALALAPAGFAGLALSGPFAWDGLIGFWLKIIAIAVWLLVMGIVLGVAVERDAKTVGSRA